MCLTALWEMNPPATALNSALSELYTSDMWLPSEQASRVAQLGLHFLRPSSPNKNTLDAKLAVPRFALFPKHHMVFHALQGLLFASIQFQSCL